MKDEKTKYMKCLRSSKKSSDCGLISQVDPNQKALILDRDHEEQTMLKKRNRGTITPLEID